MEGNLTDQLAKKQNSIRKAVAVLVLLYGAFNLLTGGLGIFQGGLSILGTWVWISLALFGAGLIFGGVVLLARKFVPHWRKIALIIVLLSLAAFFASWFYRGIAWSHMINIIVAFVFLNFAKE